MTFNLNDKRNVIIFITFVVLSYFMIKEIMLLLLSATIQHCNNNNRKQFASVVVDCTRVTICLVKLLAECWDLLIHNYTDSLLMILLPIIRRQNVEFNYSTSLIIKPHHRTNSLNICVIFGPQLQSLIRFGFAPMVVYLMD